MERYNGGNHYLVIRDHDHNKIPVYRRGNILVIRQGQLEFTRAQWNTLKPTVCPDTGKILSVKSGTMELFDAAKITHKQHQRQLDPMQPAVSLLLNEITWNGGIQKSWGIESVVHKVR